MRMGKPYDLVFTTKIVAVLTFLFTGRKKSVFLYTFVIFAQSSLFELMSGIKDLDILLSNMEPVLDKRDFVSSMKSKTATIFVSGNECLFLSTSFFLALLHGGSVPIIVGTMNNYVNFLFEIKTQPGVLLRPKR